MSDKLSQPHKPLSEKSAHLKFLNPSTIRQIKNLTTKKPKLIKQVLPPSQTIVSPTVITPSVISPTVITNQPVTSPTVITPKMVAPAIITPAQIQPTEDGLQVTSTNSINSKQTKQNIGQRASRNKGKEQQLSQNIVIKPSNQLLPTHLENNITTTPQISSAPVIIPSQQLTLTDNTEKTNNRNKTNNKNKKNNRNNKNKKNLTLHQPQIQPQLKLSPSNQIIPSNVDLIVTSSVVTVQQQVEENEEEKQKLLSNIDQITIKPSNQTVGVSNNARRNTVRALVLQAPDNAKPSFITQRIPESTATSHSILGANDIDYNLKNIAQQQTISLNAVSEQNKIITPTVVDVVNDSTIEDGNTIHNGVAILKKQKQKQKKNQKSKQHKQNNQIVTPESTPVQTEPSIQQVSVEPEQEITTKKQQQQPSQRQKQQNNKNRYGVKNTSSFAESVALPWDKSFEFSIIRAHLQDWLLLAFAEQKSLFLTKYDFNTWLVTTKPAIMSNVVNTVLKNRHSKEPLDFHSYGNNDKANDTANIDVTNDDIDINNDDDIDINNDDDNDNDDIINGIEETLEKKNIFKKPYSINIKNPDEFITKISKLAKSPLFDKSSNIFTDNQSYLPTPLLLSHKIPNSKINYQLIAPIYRSLLFTLLGCKVSPFLYRKSIVSLQKLLQHGIYQSILSIYFSFFQKRLTHALCFLYSERSFELLTKNKQLYQEQQQQQNAQKPKQRKNYHYQKYHNRPPIISPMVFLRNLLINIPFIPNKRYKKNPNQNQHQNNNPNIINNNNNNDSTFSSTIDIPQPTAVKFVPIIVPVASLPASNLQTNATPVLTLQSALQSSLQPSLQSLISAASVPLSVGGVEQQLSVGNGGELNSSTQQTTTPLSLLFSKQYPDSYPMQERFFQAGYSNIPSQMNSHEFLSLLPATAVQSAIIAPETSPATQQQQQQQQPFF